MIPIFASPLPQAKQCAKLSQQLYEGAIIIVIPEHMKNETQGSLAPESLP